jgi:hypothetical protein
VPGGVCGPHYPAWPTLCHQQALGSCATKLTCFRRSGSTFSGLIGCFYERTFHRVFHDLATDTLLNGFLSFTSCLVVTH